MATIRLINRGDTALIGEFEIPNFYVRPDVVMYQGEPFIVYNDSDRNGVVYIKASFARVEPDMPSSS